MRPKTTNPRLSRSISMPADAWARLDAACRLTGESRGRWVERATRSVCEAPEGMCEVSNAAAHVMDSRRLGLLTTPCGAACCGAPAVEIDRCGVGWCEAHMDLSPFGGE